MEYEEVVVSDRWFKDLAAYPGFELAADGASIIQNDVYTVYTYVRRRDWEKKQPPFGPEAQAARERIEKARMARFHVGPEDEMLLREHEFALLRNVTTAELQAYVEAEERIAAFLLEQRGLLEKAGERSSAWANETERAEFFQHFDCSLLYARYDNLPNWETVRTGFEPDEVVLLLDLGRRIESAELAQYEVGDMMSARYIDSHPKEYPMHQDPREA